jgi:hypothetical protein
MSVIGRLDDQVDAILISPLEKQPRSKTDAAPEAPDERANPQAPSTTQSEIPASGSNRNSESAPSGGVELPVWLL